MAKKYFDPFDPNNRDKRPRRRKEEVLAAQRDWSEKINKEMEKVMELYGDSDYILSAVFLEYALMSSEYFTFIKRNFDTLMGSRGFVKMPANTKDKRWRIDGANTHVYKKSGKPDLNLSQLKQYLG